MGDGLADPRGTGSLADADVIIAKQFPGSYLQASSLFTALVRISRLKSELSMQVFYASTSIPLSKFFCAISTSGFSISLCTHKAISVGQQILQRSAPTLFETTPETRIWSWVEAGSMEKADGALQECRPCVCVQACVALVWIPDATLSSTRTQVRKAYDIVTSFLPEIHYFAFMSSQDAVPRQSRLHRSVRASCFLSSARYHRWTRSRMVSILQASQFQASSLSATQVVLYRSNH